MVNPNVNHTTQTGDDDYKIANGIKQYRIRVWHGRTSADMISPFSSELQAGTPMKNGISGGLRGKIV